MTRRDRSDGAARRLCLLCLLCRLAVLVLGVAGCGSEPSGDAGTPDGGFDASVADGGIFDAGAPDAGHADAGNSDAGDGRLRLALRDGGSVSGLLAARYDHRGWWWTPSDEVTWALLRPEAFAAGTADRSVTFVSSRDVVTEPPLPPWPEPGVFDFTRDAGLSLGRVPLDGVAWVITGHDSYHLEEDGYGDFAWDLVRTDADGGRFLGAGANNTDYFVWDAPVYLPTDGRVVEVVRDGPDNVPGGYDAGAVNNLVGVRIAGAWAVYLLHFRQGTIPGRAAGTCEPTAPGVRCVEPGEWLPAGTYLGRVGNSGVSREPHLHLTMLYLDVVTGRAWSVPTEFAGVWESGSPNGPAVLRDTAVPLRRTWISSTAF